MQQIENSILQTTINGTTIAIAIPIIGQYMELLGSDSIEETLTMIADMTDPGILNQQTHANAFTCAYDQAEHDILNDYNQTNTASRIRPTDPQTGALLPDGRATTLKLLGLNTTPTNTYERDAQQAADIAMHRITAQADDQPTPTSELMEALTPYIDTIQNARDTFTHALADQYMHPNKEENR